MFSRLSPPFSLVGTVVKYITLPFTMLYAFNSLFNYREKSNEINIKSKLTGLRKVAYSKLICIGDAFEKAKRNKVSINDIFLTTITLTLS